MADEKLTWRDIVADAIRDLGGSAHLKDINKRIKGHPKTNTNPTWEATIRRVVRQYKIFQPVPPKNSGVYRLDEAMPLPKLQEQNLDSLDAQINHGVAQGMLLALGKIYGYETFVPTHDQTIRNFQGKKLADLVTIQDCNEIFRGRNVPQIREIDAIWFDEDDEGLFPVYAFEVEHTTGIKSGLDRLLKIPQRYPVRRFILAPGEKENTLFNRLINQAPFKIYSDSFHFRLYDSLEDMYNAAIAHEEERRNFGIVERYRR